MSGFLMLGEVCRFEYGSNLPSRDRMIGNVPVFGSNGVVGSHTTALTNGPTIVIGRKGSIGEIHLSDQPCWPIDTTYYVDQSCTDCDLLWLSLQLKYLRLSELNKASGVPGLNRDDVYALEIVVPEVNEQRRIAAHLKAQLSAVEEARNAAHAQASDVQKLIPAILKAAFEEVADAEMVRIGDVAPTTSGSTPSRSQKDYWEPANHSWVKTGEVVFNPIRSTEEQISEKALRECSLTLLPPGTVLVAMYGQGKTRGQSAVLEVEATTNQACFAILPNEAFEPEYLQLWLRHSYEALRTLSEARGGNQSNLNGALLNAFEVPLIPRKQQQDIAKRIRQALTEVAALKARIHEQLHGIDLLPARLLTAAFNETEYA